MLLEPVSSSDNLELRDKDAAAPKDLSKGDDLKKEVNDLLGRLTELQSVFYADARHSLVIVLQGRDASGKDGVATTVIGAFHPAGVRVNSFKAPTPLELSHDFLWRVHQVMPEKGMISVFNRSHYEDVLVVRVHNLVSKPVWSKRYKQINDFEQMLSENGTVILKFFLHVSRDEQRTRLIDRVEDETKNWKFKAGDLDERALWDDYTAAYRDVLKKTSTKWAPWYLVPADSNKARNYLIAKTIVEALESLDLRYPDPKADLKHYLAGLK
jgi:PPK2 family polyphosphate:nucleotide phosphotransferase